MWQGIKNIYHYFVAMAAASWYGFPSNKLIVIGVTGTDGKTTTVHMIYQMLKAAHKKVSMVSTIAAVVGGKTHETGLHVTTPDPFLLQKFLKQAVDHGDTYFVLEVSSHSLDQNRVAFTHFTVGVLTNLSHEHLDYHKTFANYANAKFKLLRAAQEVVVIPFDGIPKEVLPYADFNNTTKEIITFGLSKGKEIQRNWQFHLAVPGDYNILNALAAAGVGNVLGLQKKTILQGLEKFTGIPGRFEEIKTGKNFRVIIDFAHKPNALEQVLKSARKYVQEKGRVIVMYGCASERDILKRPMMGAISGRLAEITVLTDEDPRWEDSIKILSEIAKGCRDAGAVEVEHHKYRRALKTKKHVFFKIPNRQKAIEFIIKELAQEGDIILLCGKGHEKSISYRGIEEPWSEHAAVRQALEASS